MFLVKAYFIPLECVNGMVTATSINITSKNDKHFGNKYCIAHLPTISHGMTRAQNCACASDSTLTQLAWPSQGGVSSYLRYSSTVGETSVFENGPAVE